MNHFLTIQKASRDGLYYYNYEYYWLEEDCKVLQLVDVIDRATGERAEEVDFPHPKTMNLSSFAVNVDAYMGHPGRIFGDEDLVDEICRSFIFDENFFE